MKVLVVHTLPPEFNENSRLSAEFDLCESAAAVGSALPGAVVCGIAGRPDEFIELIRTHQPDVVFNLCEAPLGRPALEAHAAALWEWLGVRFTGSRSGALGFCRLKDRVKLLLAAHNIPVAGQGGFPCVVKPADEDGSAGIGPDSICRNVEDMHRVIRRLRGRPLVEAFIPGREFAVSIWGRKQAEYFSIGETVFGEGLQLVTYEAKWRAQSRDYKNSPVSYDTQINPALRRQLIELGRRVWSVVGAYGYLRADIRLDDAGVPRVLDVNPNSSLDMDEGMGGAALEAGWTWRRFIQTQVKWAC